MSPHTTFKFMGFLEGTVALQLSSTHHPRVAWYLYIIITRTIQSIYATKMGTRST